MNSKQQAGGGELRLEGRGESRGVYDSITQETNRRGQRAGGRERKAVCGRQEGASRPHAEEAEVG